MGKRYIIGINFFLLIVWAAFVLWAFFQSFPFINLLEVLKNGLVLFFLLALFTALGRRVFRVFKISFSTFAEECSFSFGLGTGIVIVLFIGLAALQLLYEIVIFGLILVLFGLVYADARYICITGYKILTASSTQHISFINGVFIVLMGFAGIVTFLAAATPPFFYDALVYHLAVPQQYLLAHGFHYMPHHHFSNFPINLNMLFMVGMSLSGGMLAKLLSWLFAPMSAIAVYGFAKSRWGTHIAIMAAAILSLVPGVLILSTLTSVDLGVMFYSFLSFSALLSWFSSGQKQWFILSGVFCGLAVGTKYTALVTTFAAILIILFIHECFYIKKHRLFNSIRSLLLYGIIVLCMVLPWLIKNTLYTGNPIYPLFNSLIGTSISHQYTYYDRKISATNPVYTLFHSFVLRPQKVFNLILYYLKAPWSFSMATTRAAGKTGVLFLLCLPLVFLVKKKDTDSKYLFALGLCSFWLWVILLPQTALRYVFQMFPPLSLATAYILWSLSISRRSKTWILSGISVILIYHLCFLGTALDVFQPFSYLFNNQPQEQFLVNHGVNYYPAIQFANQETPKNAKILYVGELRSYYCERDILLATDGYQVDEEIILRQLIIESKDSEEVIRKLEQLGITHILLNFSEMQRFAKGKLARESFFGFQTEKDKKIFQTLFSHYLRLLISEYQVNLYEILYPATHG